MRIPNFVCWRLLDSFRGDTGERARARAVPVREDGGADVLSHPVVPHSFFPRSLPLFVFDVQCWRPRWLHIVSQWEPADH